MGSYYWIKVYHEVLHDPKMGRLSDHLWRRFFELCLIAGEEDKEGWLPEVGNMAWTLRTTTGDLEADLHLLMEHQLVSLDPDGAWFVTKFADRQSPLSPAERKAKQRERDRQRDYESHGPVTQGVTIRDTEQDTDTDTDTDQDTDKRQRQIRQDNGDAAAECLQAVLELGIKEPKASKLVKQAEHDGVLSTMPDDLRDWIAHYRQDDTIRNPVGLAITQVEARVTPPLRAGPIVASLPY